MARYERTLETVLSGRADAGIRLTDLRRLLIRLGFKERIRGSHHTFRREGVAERLNLQGRRGQAKAYQVRQVRRVIVKYGLEEEK